MGVEKMTAYLRRRKKKKVGPKRVRRLMRKMGLEAICPGPNTSRRRYDHKIYPYLLKDVEITKPDQVWASDITYIRLSHGFVYLVAIIDWHSRYVINWKLSNTLDTDFCLEALEEALTFGTPEIFNTDQGSQFTSTLFVNQLLEKGIQVSMDGRGRAFDNIFVERLWRTLKYEEIYLNNYATIPDVERGIEKYFEYYNYERLHQGLGYITPWEMYYGIAEDMRVIHSIHSTNKERKSSKKKETMITAINTPYFY